jgi:hypothetical protein
VPGDPRIGATDKNVLHLLHLLVAENAARVCVCVWGGGGGGEV